MLLADEPTGNLDTANGQVVTRLLRKLVDDQRQTIVMVTHDPVVAGHADRIIHIRDGRIEDEEGAATAPHAKAAWAERTA
jgi:putative ABC transport system ATP-binding protein